MLGKKISLLFVLFFFIYAIVFVINSHAGSNLSRFVLGFEKMPKASSQRSNKSLGSIMLGSISSQTAKQYSHLLNGHKVEVKLSNQKKVLPGDIIVEIEGQSIFEESDIERYVKESDFYKIQFGRITTSGVVRLEKFEHSIYITPPAHLKTPDVFKFVKRDKRDRNGKKHVSFEYFWAVKKYNEVFVMTSISGFSKLKHKFSSNYSKPQMNRLCDEKFNLYRPSFISSEYLIKLYSGKAIIFNPWNCMTREIIIPEIGSGTSKVGKLAEKKGLFFATYKGCCAKRINSIWNEKGQLVVQEKGSSYKEFFKRYDFTTLEKGDWTINVVGQCCLIVNQ